MKRRRTEEPSGAPPSAMIPLAASLALVEEAVERTKSEIGFPERAAEFIRDGLRALAKTSG